MKKFISLLLAVLLLAVSSVPFVSVESARMKISEETSFVLPLQLQSVGEDAFAGTAVETVAFPEGFHQIEDGAFAGAEKLSDVYLPVSAASIGASAFPENEALTVHAQKGSAARNWALSHKVRFREDARRMPAEKGHSLSINLYSAHGLFGTVSPERRTPLNAVYIDHSMRPQDRPELYPIDYRFP